jgi:hypothetical protein
MRPPSGVRLRRTVGHGRTTATAALILAGAWVIGCGEARPATAPAAEPRVPADLIPGDLDVVVRVDLAAIRGALGDAALTELRARAQLDGDSRGDRFVDAAIARGSTAWFAFRPDEAAGVLDHVLVLRGRFDALDPRETEGAARWTPPLPMRAAWRRYDAVRPPARTEPARIYLRDSTVAVALTAAEIDPIERSLELGQAPEARLAPVLPPIRGTLAGAARSRSIAGWFRDLEPFVADLLGAAQRLSIVLDLPDSGLSGEILLTFGDDAGSSGPERSGAAAAATTAAHLERLRRASTDSGGLAERIARQITVVAEGETVRCEVEFDRATLAAIVAPAPPRPTLADPGAGASSP